ncbi:hypothetical protein RDABS01_023209 [Bienertia sinuspersici]
MKSVSNSPLIKNDDKSSHKEEDDEEIDGFLKSRKAIRNTIDEEDLNARVTCMTFYSRRRNSLKSKQEQKDKDALLRRQVKAKCSLEVLFDKQLKRYNQSLIPNKLEDATQLLASPPLELVSVGWLGDWRPSAILELLKSLAHSSYLSSSLAESTDTDRMLSQLIREIRIEEAIIDEEMAEIQATCILHLPFGPTSRVTTSSMAPMECAQSQLMKIKQVTAKAQQLRCKVLELIVKKVLNKADAGEFLVAFTGIQDIVHQFAARQKLQKGPVNVSVKSLTTV